MRRSLPTLLAVAVAAHLVAQLALTRANRFFASEDDGYRLYQAYLLCTGQSGPIGRFWLPGQLAMTCPALVVGLPPVWAGVLVSCLSLLVLVLAMAALTRALAPDEQRGRATVAAALLVLASPMAMTLSHSALAELPAAAACTVAALSLAERARGRARAWLVLGTIAMLVATWTRYESWPLALVYPLAAGWRRRGDAAIAALAWLGPLAWMALQWRAYGDPLTFVHATAEITGLSTHTGVLALIGHRLWALLLWAPVPLVGALFARHRGAWLFFAWMALGVLVPTLSGAEHPVFPARLAFALEVGLVPAVALAWSAWRARVALVVALLALVPLVLATARRPTYLDPASVAVGKALRKGRLAPPAGGTLLVDRPLERPPLGWASLAAAWGAWEKIAFATRAEEGWELVLPTDVQGARWRVPAGALGAWLDAHSVTAAWCVTASCAKTLRVAWPLARVRTIGSGWWITR
jgi:hypothetical protein